jgi:restriction system protein
MLLHSEYISGQEIGDNPYYPFCRYCNSRLIIAETEDCWPIDNDQILSAHQETIKIHKDLHDLEDCYLNLNLDSQSSEVRVEYCWSCGWWRLIKTISIGAEAHQMWDIVFGCAGILKQMDAVDVNVLMDEIRRFLVRNYENRINVEPKLFENLVASVFKSLNYSVLATGYTHDGGIDMVLINSDNKQIGVQVKNTKNLIEVEQLRSFLGALLLKNIPEGLFITTSSFRSGANKFSEKASQSGIPIKFMNASAFYDALKIAQISDNIGKFYPFKMDSDSIPQIDYYGWNNPLNAL